jgi:hypothetical protein
MHKRVRAGLPVVALATGHEAVAEEVERGLAILLLREASELLRRKRVRQRLHLWTPSRDYFAAFDLQKSASRNLADVLLMLLAVLLVLLVDVEQQFLQLVARKQILVVEARAHTQMKRLF